jgi:stearoyl-CoA desaturase (delta-9 desaturase)
MRYLASTSYTLFILQLLSLITILIGLLVVPVSWEYVIVSVVAFYCYSILGISMMMHRFYTHKSFQLHPVIKWIFTVFAILAGRGSPLGWVYIHRMHHATSDTEKDPHSPHFANFNIIGFKPVYDESKKINYFVIKELLTPAHINIDKYYMLCIIAFVTMLGSINPVLIFYVWAAPVFAVSISQVAFNYFAHKHGYRNFVTKDCSTNNVYLWPFILGDAWHNNHHGNPASMSTQLKWWELDPVKYIISVIRK